MSNINKFSRYYSNAEVLRSVRENREPYVIGLKYITSFVRNEMKLDISRASVGVVMVKHAVKLRDGRYRLLISEIIDIFTKQYTIQPNNTLNL